MAANVTREERVHLAKIWMAKMTAEGAELFNGTCENTAGDLSALAKGLGKSSDIALVVEPWRRIARLVHD